MAAILGAISGAAQDGPKPQQPMQQAQSPFNFSGQTAPSPQQFSQGVQQAAPSAPLKKQGSSLDLMGLLNLLGGSK